MKVQPLFEVENEVRIDLFTMKNPTEPQFLIKNNLTSIKESNFNPKKATRIYIHGWQSRGELKAALTNGQCMSIFFENWQIVNI